MEDPAHRQALGAWLTDPDHDALVASHRVTDSAAYRELVATILIAAHEYRQMHDAWNDRHHPGCGAAVPPTDAARAPAPPAALFNALAARRGLTCPGCAGPLSYRDTESVDENGEDESPVGVVYGCTRCATVVPHSFPLSDLTPPDTTA
jgi:hypothetical protein